MEGSIRPGEVERVAIAVTVAVKERWMVGMGC